MESFSSNLFNYTILTSMIVNINEFGFFEELSKSNINIDSYCNHNKIQQLPFKIIIDSLSEYNIVKIDQSTISKGEEFEKIKDNIGYFECLIKGYSYALTNADLILKKDILNTKDVLRSGDSIAKAGKKYGQKFVDPFFYKIVKEIQPNKILDIGCGSAERLIKICIENPKVNAIGIDINQNALDIALNNIKANKLESRIEMIQSDVNILEFKTSFTNIDLICSFFMGHDLFPEDNCFHTLNRFSSLFPNAKNFILCDTYKASHLSNEIFTLGFEYFHSLMGQAIPTKKDWYNLFDRLNWSLDQEINIDIPNSVIFNLNIKNK